MVPTVLAKYPIFAKECVVAVVAGFVVFVVLVFFWGGSVRAKADLKSMAVLLLQPSHVLRISNVTFYQYLPTQCLL